MLVTLPPRSAYTRFNSVDCRPNTSSYMSGTGFCYPRSDGWYIGRPSWSICRGAYECLLIQEPRFQLFPGSSADLLLYFLCLIAVLRRMELNCLGVQGVWWYFTTSSHVQNRQIARALHSAIVCLYRSRTSSNNSLLPCPILK